MHCRTPRLLLLVPFVFMLGLFSARLPKTIDTVARVGGFRLALNDPKNDFEGPIDDVKRMLVEGYVEEPDLKKLQDGAINGMLEALDDPYALYVPPVDRAEFEKEVMGHYAGIGAVVQIEDGYPTVASPMEDSPAFRAGLHPKDRITAIDGAPTMGMTIDQCVSKLTGESGTNVELSVNRAGQTLTFNLKRQEIIVRSVKGVIRSPEGEGNWNYFLDPDSRIAYMRLTQFISTSPNEMRRAFKQMGIESKKLGGLILDLRENPGGDLDACLEIADMFLAEGQILSIRGRNGQSQSFDARRSNTLPEFPVMILVNGRSASASEILSGALSDHDRAIVLGSRTFGKGLVQTVRTLPSANDAQVKFTAQRYYLPSGRLIHRTDESKDWGVDPSPGFYIPMTDAEEITLFAKRQELDIIMNGLAVDGQKIQMWSDPDWIEKEFKDKQLSAALRAMRGYVQNNVWTTVSDVVQQPSLVSRDELRKLERAHERMVKTIAQVEHRMERLDATLAGAPKWEPADLWPDTLDLTDGHIKVYDKDGKEVADLRMTGRDVERWLALSEVQRLTPLPPPATTTAPTPPTADAAGPAPVQEPQKKDP